MTNQSNEFYGGIARGTLAVFSSMIEFDIYRRDDIAISYKPGCNQQFGFLFHQDGVED